MTQPPYPSSWPDPSSPAGGEPTPGPPPEPPQWNPPPGPPPFYRIAGPPGYGQPGGVPGYGPPPPKTNSMAVASLVVSIGSAVTLVCVVCLTFFAVLPLGGGVTGAILGAVARRRIRERGEQGAGMALAGIVVGLLAAAFGLLAVVVMALWIGYGAFSGSL